MRNSEISYIAGRDVVDSLKLEASSFSPRRDERLRQVALDTVDIISHDYASYIPRSTTLAVQGVEDRVICLDSDTYGVLFNNWINPDVSEDAYIFSNSHGMYMTYGRLILLNDINMFWAKLPEELKQSEIAKYEGEDKAKSRWEYMGATDTLIHEVVHQFQNPKLPEAFLESGVRFYQREVQKKLQLGAPLIDRDEALIYHYKNLVTKYDTDMHNVFFGNVASPEITQAILDDEIVNEISHTYFDRTTDFPLE